MWPVMSYGRLPTQKYVNSDIQVVYLWRNMVAVNEEVHSTLTSSLDYRPFISDRFIRLDGSREVAQYSE